MDRSELPTANHTRAERYRAAAGNSTAMTLENAPSLTTELVATLFKEMRFVASLLNEILASAVMLSAVTATMPSTQASLIHFFMVLLLCLARLITSTIGTAPNANA